jgi:hypothetical protein
LFIILVCYFCWNGGQFEGEEKEILFRHGSFLEDSRVCEIEGKKVSKFGENIDVSFWRLFIIGAKGLYRIYHIVYETNREEKIFLTYKFPLTLGIGAITENTDILIEEREDSIVIYYNKKPSDEFKIEQNPFSKKVYFEYRNDLTALKKIDNLCY